MIYRDEARALRDRRDQLIEQLRGARAAEGQAEAARASVSANADAGIRSGRKLPLLEDIRIASPCNVSWESMRGDSRTRFCGQCKKNVYNLSEMTRVDAETFLASQEVKPCVRLYMRKDGSVLTSDCPTQSKRRATVAAASGAISLIVAGLGWLGFTQKAREFAARGEMHVTMGAPPVDSSEPIPIMGDMAEPEPTPSGTAPAPTTSPTHTSRR